MVILYYMRAFAFMRLMRGIDACIVRAHSAVPFPRHPHLNPTSRWCLHFVVGWRFTVPESQWSLPPCAVIFGLGSVSVTGNGASSSDVTVCS